MDLNNIKLFKKIVDSGSFLKAGQNLNIDPSVITRRIAKFEKELNQKLMTRSKKGVFLTDAGEEAYKVALNIENLEEDLLEKFSNKKSNLSGEIKIYTSTGTINTWLVSASNKFLEDYPDVNLNIWSTNEPLELVDHKADVIIGPNKKRYDTFEKLHIRTYHLKAFASEKYIQKFGRPKDYDDFDNHRLISFASVSPGAFGEPDWFLIGQKGIRKPYMNINSSIGLLEAGELGTGIICIGKEMVQEKGSKLIDLFPEKQGETTDIFYIFHKNLKGFKRIVLFGKFLQKNFK